MKIDKETNFTLDQFEVFVAVVDCKGFAAASRKLNRAQSAITYAIKGLEEHTGIQLFDRSTYRPTLTDAGRTLLPRARRLLADLDDYSRQASSISAGVEAQVTVATDVFAPLPLIAKALAEVHRQFASVSIKLVLESPAQALELVKSGQAHVGALSAQPPFDRGLQTAYWTAHDLVAVAAPSHPLTAMELVSPADLHGHMQLVWTPVHAPANSNDAGVHAIDRWYTSDLGSKRTLILAGVGWGSLPDHLVEQDIAEGRLVRLKLQSWEGRDRMPHYETVVAWQRHVTLGPVAKHLIEALRT